MTKRVAPTATPRSPPPPPPRPPAASRFGDRKKNKKKKRSERYDDYDDDGGGGGPTAYAFDDDDDDDDYERRGRLPRQQRRRRRFLYRGVCSDVSDRYRKVVNGRIGEGTYGVVYCARDTWLEAAGDGDDVNDGDGRWSSDARGNRSNTTTTTTTGGGNRNNDNDGGNRRKPKNEIVALKKCYAHHEASDGFPITTLREIHALRVCSSHPNVVDLLEIAVSQGGGNNSSNSGGKNEGGGGDANGSATTKSSSSSIRIGRSNVFLVFEHCRYDLAQILDSHYRYQHRQQSDHHRRRPWRSSSSSPFSLPVVKTLTRQLLSALAFCHSHGLVHRDVKPSNLLYDTVSGRLKLCDFGLSRIASSSSSDGGAPMTPNVVSLWYRAPELLLPAAPAPRETDDRTADRARLLRYSFPIDLWAAGCVVIELLEGRPALDGSSEIEQIEKMEGFLGPFPSRLYHHHHLHRRAEQEPPAGGERRTTKGDRDEQRRECRRHQRVVGLWDAFEHLRSEGLTLLAGLLDYDPTERWTAPEALDSAFLSGSSDPAPIRDLRTMPKGFPGC